MSRGISSRRGPRNADQSNGYEGIAPIFISGRGSKHSGIGVAVVAEWSLTLPAGGSVLDLGCGTGVPISHALMERGFRVYGIDASPSMIQALRARFPKMPVQCVAVEEADFFGLRFDGVVAWGLLFLLGAEVQRRLIARISDTLPVGGKLLFTAPQQVCSWLDVMTGQASVSLGFDGYRSAIEDSGLSLVRTALDEGENHYYFAEKK